MKKTEVRAAVKSGRFYEIEYWKTFFGADEDELIENIEWLMDDPTPDGYISRWIGIEERTGKIVKLRASRGIITVLYRNDNNHQFSGKTMNCRSFDYPHNPEFVAAQVDRNIHNALVALKRLGLNKAEELPNARF